KNPLPEYQLISSKGKDHNAIFTVRCVLQKPKMQITRNAKSIKYAEQACAQILLDKLGVV
ncbi:MAG: ribonuclease III, partial [Candidatus Thioglobus sp.]|nr:ribonuclease III [Candidatus Thioglobus sp.]